jgi:hypothetical protein
MAVAYLFLLQGIMSAAKMLTPGSNYFDFGILGICIFLASDVVRRDGAHAPWFSFGSA